MSTEYEMRRADCKYCQVNFEYLWPLHVGVYCSRKCCGLYKRNVESREKFEQGRMKERDIIRRFLVERHGERCSVCSIADWMSQPVSFQVDHIDGDASNNRPTNPRLLCPTCHTQTPFYGGKNKGKGRKARGLPEY